MKAIDFRVRPPYDAFVGQFSYDSWPGNLVKSLQNLGIKDPMPMSYQHSSMEEFMQECEQNEIVASVIAGRNGVSNDALEELTVKYPGQFYFFPYVNVADIDQAKEIVDRYVLNGKGYGKGVTIEPGIPIDGKTYQVNDERFYPVYEYLEQNNLTVMLTQAIMTVPYMDNNIPYYVDRVLAVFPKMNVVLGHAGSPWGREFGALLMKRDNLYLAIDHQLLMGVGYQDYREAVNVAPDKCLFASSYPVTTPADMKAAYEHGDFIKPENREMFFYGNAAKLLGIED